MKKWIFAVIILFLALLTLNRIREQRKGTASPTMAGMSGRRATASVAVETAPILHEAIRDTGMFTGTVHARNRYNVAPRISGRLRRLAVDIGDLIRHGDLIALIDDDEFQQALQQARAEVTVARANVAQASSSLNNARREFERVKGLHSRGISSESELDSALARYEAEQARHQVAEAQVQQRKSALAAAEVRLSYTRILARWEGEDGERVIGERFVDEGAMISTNTPIVSVLDLDSVIIAINVTERDYARLSPGQNAMVHSDALPYIQFEGHIIRMAPMLQESSRQARVEILVDNPEHQLKPGMFVRANILFQVFDKAATVPAEAIVVREGRDIVYVIDPEGPTAMQVEIQKGVTENNRVQVISPPISGDVVTLGQHLLSDGISVTIPGSEKSAGRGGANGARAVSDDSGADTRGARAGSKKGGS